MASKSGGGGGDIGGVAWRGNNHQSWQQYRSSIAATRVCVWRHQRGMAAALSMAQRARHIGVA